MSSNPIVGAHGRDVTAAEAAQMAAPPPLPATPITFHDVLEAINPLQYLPVIGTIYRVATGDEGSPTLRTAFSLVGGLLMGGPVGLLTSMAGQLAEHYLHLEHMARSLVAPTPRPTPPAAAPVAAKAAAADPGAHASPPAAAAPASPVPAAPAPAIPAPATPAPAAPTQATPIQATPTQAGPGPVPQATPAVHLHLATQMVAAYVRSIDLPTRIVPGGREG